MGSWVSTTVCFGVDIGYGEVIAVPWLKSDKYEKNIEVWWQDANGFNDIYPSIYDESGEYLDKNISEDKIKAYHDAERDWWKENPLPVREVIYGAYDSCGVIISISSTVQEGYRGSDGINLDKLTYTKEELDTLLNFFKKHNIDISDHLPKWYMSAYYG